VPVVLMGSNSGLKEGRLADLAPTLLDLMGINRPAEMTGHSLVGG
jgi:2,3-bisphosphoglycerate-independent phosphoglycerate mutase